MEEEAMDAMPSHTGAVTRNQVYYATRRNEGVIPSANFDYMKHQKWMPFNIGTFDNPFLEKVCTISLHYIIYRFADVSSKILKSFNYVYSICFLDITNTCMNMVNRNLQETC